jgi:tRNA uridine 5-carbamoylmethylation protein Kti12
MFIIVFLLGCPGSGKSSAASLIQMFVRDHGWLIHSINDYEHLQKMFVREKAECTSLDERDFIQRESERCNGFDVKNFAVLSTVLEEMRQEVEDIRGTCPQDKITVCTIEFARANYQNTLELFGDELLAESHILYFNVDLDICLERNHNRTDHFISDEIMASYYRFDDWSREIYNLQHGYDKCEIKNTGTFEDLKRKVEEWFESHLEHRVLVSEEFTTIG